MNILKSHNHHLADDSIIIGASPVALTVKNLPTMRET